jgi:BirA family biotin operon repressor/biotin-[acetyl-CoA-carboxylase] ligase
MPLIDTLVLKNCLGASAARFDVDALATCDSTSSELLRRAERGLASGSVVVADQQTAGRGRRGRSWLSAPEDSLTFSLLWRFDGPVTRLAGLSLAVGCALAQALDHLGAAGICLKWPNDVLLRQENGYAKLAGILVELASDRRGTQAVIGIGLNLAAPPVSLDQTAAGLDSAMAKVPERHLVLAEILRSLLAVLENFAVDGFSGLKNDWQQWHAWQNREVYLAGDGGNTGLRGRCLGVDDDGALLLDTGSCVEHVWSGDLSLRVA